MHSSYFIFCLDRVFDSSMDHLSERQRQALTTFQEISQVSDQDLAIQILQENQWNIDLAVENFMSFGGGSSRRNRSSGNRSPALTERSSPRLSANRAETSRETEHENGNQENTPPSNSIFDSILSRLKWLYQGQLQSRNPDLDTRKFIGQFELNYSTQHPAFHNRGYQSAVARAFETSKFLLVYLHSPMHEDSQKFIQQTFCTQSFSAFADQHVITWIGNVWDEQAYTLGNQLRVTQFPFLALLLCQSDRMVKVIARQEGSLIIITDLDYSMAIALNMILTGHIEEADLIDKLRNAISVNTVVVNQIQAEATRRREFSALREQQDREYRELEEQDRRERERREQEEREAIRREHVISFMNI